MLAPDACTPNSVYVGRYETAIHFPDAKILVELKWLNSGNSRSKRHLILTGAAHNLCEELAKRGRESRLWFSDILPGNAMCCT